MITIVIIILLLVLYYCVFFCIVYYSADMPFSNMCCISSQVIHYELPSTSEIFVHRSGRTGRAGKKGSAILIYGENQTRDVRCIERDVGCKFKEVSTEAFDEGELGKRTVERERSCMLPT